MKIWLWWRHRDPQGLERAREADEQATREHRRARENAAWVDRTLAVNHLTEIFLNDLLAREKPR